LLRSAKCVRIFHSPQNVTVSVLNLFSLRSY
jgi:hypothetical protein